MGACGLMSRKASVVSSSWTLVEGHLPERMLSNAVAGPAPVNNLY